MVSIKAALLVAITASVYASPLSPDISEGAVDGGNNATLVGPDIGLPCFQDSCPDGNQAFDLLKSTQGVDIFEIRVKDCGHCYKKKVGYARSGCYKFDSCNGKQMICVDPVYNRAHRVKRDTDEKTCYRMQYADLGSCDLGKAPIKRVLWRPEKEVTCDW